MILFEMFEQKPLTLMDAIRDFLPFVMDSLELSDLPTLDIVKTIETANGQPTFGRFNPNEVSITVAIQNRNPNDIIRTLAHELVHYKQHIGNRLASHSGDTGSEIENEANAEAGVIMRNFNKRYPQYLSLKAVDFETK